MYGNSLQIELHIKMLEGKVAQATAQREEWERQSRHHELEAERYEKALKRILEPLSAEQPHHIARRALAAYRKKGEGE